MEAQAHELLKTVRKVRFVGTDGQRFRGISVRRFANNLISHRIVGWNKGDSMRENEFRALGFDVVQGRSVNGGALVWAIRVNEPNRLGII